MMDIMVFSWGFLSGFCVGIVSFIISGYAFIKKGATLENLTTKNE